MNVTDAEEYTQALGQVAAGAWRQIALGERLGVPATLGLSTREWVEHRLGGYVRLSIPDRREAVAELVEEGHSQRKIADVLGVDEGTIRNDLKPDAESSAPEPEQPQASNSSVTVDAESSAPEQPSKAVADYLSEVADDQTLQDINYTRSFLSAMQAAGKVTRFDAERVGLLLEEEEIKLLRLHAESVSRFTETAERARRGLRVVEGGRG